MNNKQIAGVSTMSVVFVAAILTIKTSLGFAATPTLTPTPAPGRIVLSHGHGGITINKLIRASDLGKITSFPGLPKNFAQLFGISRERSANTAVADINDDGVKDIVVGFGSGGMGSTYPSILLAWSVSGGVNDGPRAITSRNVFPPGSQNPLLQNPQGALNVAAGNFVGDDLPMIVAAQGLGGRSLIRLLQYGEVGGRKKLRLVGTFQGLTGAAARENSSGGTSVAAGDVDGDGLDELIAGQMNGPGARTLFQVVDLEKVDGVVKVLGRTNPVPAMPGGYRGRGGVTLAVGDVDGDGEQEILTATAGIPDGANESGQKSFVRAFNVAVDNQHRTTGVVRLTPPMSVFGAADNPSGGLHIAAGNLDGDSADELLVARRGSSA